MGVTFEKTVVDGVIVSDIYLSMSIDCIHLIRLIARRKAPILHTDGVLITICSISVAVLRSG